MILTIFGQQIECGYKMVRWTRSCIWSLEWGEIRYPFAVPYGCTATERHNPPNQGVKSPELWSHLRKDWRRALFTSASIVCYNRPCTGRQHMATASPEEVVQAFYRAFNNGDIETIVTLYEPRAMLVAQPGQLAEGHTAIREALRAFLAMKPAIPGKGKTPVTTMTSPLAFRKHQCDNTPLTGTLGCFDDGVCHGDCCPQRTQASLRRCALSLGS